MIAISNPSFSGHETFPFRYGWLKKGVDGIEDEPCIFSSEDAMVKLGVGKNMVRSIRHWCLTLGLAKQEGRALVPTEFGKRLLSDDQGYDPYLEDVGTLWLLHWQLASNEKRATTWYWVFNFWNQSEFIKDDVVQGLLQLIRDNGYKHISERSIKRDVDCLIRTYVPSNETKSRILEDTLDCPLVELQLIKELPNRKAYQIVQGSHMTLPDLILAHIIKTFWEQPANDRHKSLSFFDLMYQSGSPGRVLRLDENSMAERLERFEKVTRGLFLYDETSGLKQLYRSEMEVGPWDLLDEYYRR